MKPQKLLSIGSDSKTVKGEARGYRTAILYLAPARLSGREVCPHRSPECTKLCLNTAGRGSFNSVQQARINRTLAFFKDKVPFLAQLRDELIAHEESCRRNGMQPVVRLNGTSDIPWEFQEVHGKTLFEHFPEVHFYDYTKALMRACRSLTKDWPSNYRLVFSRSELNRDDCARFLALGGNVSAVFDRKPNDDLPAEYLGHPVIDGDKDDLRFLDPTPCVVGLRAKGPARNVKSGFVIA